MEYFFYNLQCSAYRFVIKPNGEEIGWATLVIIQGENGQSPLGILRDVNVKDRDQNEGVRLKLVKDAVKKAREQGCYLLVLTSRHGDSQSHKELEELGFTDHGLEFRLDLGD